MVLLTTDFLYVLVQFTLSFFLLLNILVISQIITLFLILVIRMTRGRIQVNSVGERPLRAWEGSSDGEAREEFA